MKNKRRGCLHAPYQEALNKVIAVRTQREVIYGNDWKGLQDWEILAIIREKVRRLTTFVIEKKSEAIYEKKIDILIDLINYSLFALQNELDKERKV